MAVNPIQPHAEQVSITSVYGDRPPLYIVGAEGMPSVDGGYERSPQALMDRYFELREAAKAAPVPHEADVRMIQGAINNGLRIDDPEFSLELNLRDELRSENLPYGQYDPAAVNRFRRLNHFLRVKYGAIIPPEVLDASDAFVDMVTGMYDASQRGESIADGAKGRSGFVVPARASRERPQDSVETIDPCPSLRYLPPELRVAMYAGLPPFVVDRYAADEHGRHAYMLLAPVFPDSFSDLGQTRALAVGKDMVNEAVRFGRDMLGIRVFGLGASLPMVVHYGKHINVEGVITTTGHGGTIALILKTIQALRERGEVHPKATQKIGVLGAVGSIGSSILEVVAAMYPDAEIRAYDPRAELLHAKVGKLSATERKGTVLAAQDAREVLEGSDIIISAVTGNIDLKELGVRKRRMKGTVVIDDSQPWAFDRKQVEDFGAREVWVVGEDPEGKVAKRASSWNYGGTLMQDGLFGCEAEVNVLAAFLAEVEQAFEQDPGLRERVSHAVSTDTGRPVGPIAPLDIVRDFALRRAVTPDDALKFVEFFDRYGVVAARTLQAEGQPTYFPRLGILRRRLARFVMRQSELHGRAA